MPYDAKASTRERIVEAALDLFAERGFRGTAIADIERRVGLAAGTGSFYRHFTSKDELFVAAVEQETARFMSEVVDERAQLPSPEDEHAFTVAVARQVLGDIRRFDRMFRILMRDDGVVPGVRDTITSALERSGALGSWTDDPAVLVGVAALVGFRLMDFLRPGPLDAIQEDRFVEALASVVSFAGKPTRA